MGTFILEYDLLFLVQPSISMSFTTMARNPVAFPLSSLRNVTFVSPSNGIVDVDQLSILWIVIHGLIFTRATLGGFSGLGAICECV